MTTFWRPCAAALALGLSLSAALAQDAPSPITEGEWQLLALNGARASTETTFSMAATGKVTGRAPCNSYFGQNGAKLPALAFDGIMATRMACPDLAAEGDFMAALSAVTLAELRADHLILTGILLDAPVTLEFVRDRDDKALTCLTCE